MWSECLLSGASTKLLSILKSGQRLWFQRKAGKRQYEKTARTWWMRHLVADAISQIITQACMAYRLHKWALGQDQTFTIHLNKFRRASYGNRNGGTDAWRGRPL
jgi:hypothetical protein